MLRCARRGMKIYDNRYIATCPDIWLTYLSAIRHYSDPAFYLMKSVLL